MKTRILIIGVFILFVSFHPVSKSQLEDNLIGSWSYYADQYRSGGWIKVPVLDMKNEGMEFKTNGELIVRSNAGFCGTPPITYSNYKGNWKKISDSIIIITHNYWGGTTKRKLRIKTLTDTKLIFETLSKKVEEF